jgi:hypothetical protein
MKISLTAFTLLFLVFFSSCTKDKLGTPDPVPATKGRLKMFTRDMPGNKFSKSDSTTLTYNADGQVTKFSYIYPNGAVVSYVEFSYDNRGLLSEMRVIGSGNLDAIPGRKYLYNADSTVAAMMKNDSTGLHFSYNNTDSSTQIGFAIVDVFSGFSDFPPNNYIDISKDLPSDYTVTLKQNDRDPSNYFRQFAVVDSSIVEYRFINALDPASKKDIQEKYSGRAWEETNPLYVLYAGIFKKALLPFRMEFMTNEYNFPADHDLHIRDESHRLVLINDVLTETTHYYYDFDENDKGQVTMIRKKDEAGNKIYEYHFYYE